MVWRKTALLRRNIVQNPRRIPRSIFRQALPAKPQLRGPLIQADTSLGTLIVASDQSAKVG